MHKKYWPKEYLCIYCFHFSELIPSHNTETNFFVGFSSKFWIWISKFILDLWLSAVFCPIKNIRNHSTISRSGSPAPIPESLCNEKEPPYFTCCLAFLNRTALECLKWVKKHKLCQICLRQRLFEQTSEEWTYVSTAFFHTLRLARKPLPHMARAQNISGHHKNDSETFFRFVLMYRKPIKSSAQNDR